MRISDWSSDVCSSDLPGWRVACEDTGRDSLTGTRVRRAAATAGDGPVMVTYGDGVGDIDVTALVEFHRSHGRLATITAVHPPGRFGELVLTGDPGGPSVAKTRGRVGRRTDGFLKRRT